MLSKLDFDVATFSAATMCRIGGHFDASSAAVFSDNPMPDFPTGL
jgi:hypothetical protein